MPLTCECSDDYEWMCLDPGDYATASEPARCSSCRADVQKGETVAVFGTLRYDENGDEEYGDDMVMCEVCADLFFSLTELGFCVSPEENARHLVKEYVELRDAGEFG